MNLKEAILYEIAGSWWAGFIPQSISPWISPIVANYFIYKAEKKFRRYQIYLQQKKRK